MNQFTRLLRKPVRYKSYNAVYILMGINIALFLINVILDAIPATRSLTSVFLGLSFVGVKQFYGVWQFFTYMFLHDTSAIFHILFNMFALYMIGRPLEKRLGSTEFLIFYLSSGILAGLAHFGLGGLLTLIPEDSSMAALRQLAYTPLIGASGAVFAVVLGFGVFYSESLLYLFGIMPIKARHAVLLFGALELINLLPMGNSNVSNLTHIGGLAAGWLYLMVRKNINPAKVLFKKSRY